MANEQKMDQILIAFKPEVTPAEAQEVLDQFEESKEVLARTYLISVPANEALFHARNILDNHGSLLRYSDAPTLGERVFE